MGGGGNTRPVREHLERDEIPSHEHGGKSVAKLVCERRQQHERPPRQATTRNMG
jgi:hypothetical protein